jgi:hypothetical protein
MVFVLDERNVTLHYEAIKLLKKYSGLIKIAI